jgi:hypothetical protein
VVQLWLVGCARPFDTDDHPGHRPGALRRPAIGLDCLAVRAAGCTDRDNPPNAVSSAAIVLWAYAHHSTGQIVPGGRTGVTVPHHCLCIVVGAAVRAYLSSRWWLHTVYMVSPPRLHMPLLLRWHGALGMPTFNENVSVNGVVTISRQGDGVVLLNLSTERSWAIRQLSDAHLVVSFVGAAWVAAG